MNELIEVSGAMERPAGCRIRIVQDDQTTSVEIPARGASPVMWLATGALTVVLLAWIVMGAFLLIAGKPVFILAGIANHGLTPAMHRHLYLIGPIVAGVLAIGTAELISMLRSNVTRETLVFDRTSVKHISKFLHRARRSEFPYAMVRSFYLSKDPHGVSHGTLKLICQGDDRVIGEFVSDGDREWLASVGNALLGRHTRR